jgi:hypothetical protein
MSKFESVHIRLRRDQLVRLNLLRAALAERMQKDMTLSELVEKVIDEFLESK